jgi:uncharacterized DUF497 family protein
VIEAIIAWDDDDDPRGNVQHIANNGVTVEEVEQALADPNGSKAVSRSTGRPLWFGETSTGRLLVVVYETIEQNPWVIYVVTAYEPTTSEDDLQE